MTNLTLTPMKKVTTSMMTHEQIFNEDSDDDEFLQILVCLIRLLVLKPGAIHECGLYTSIYGKYYN